MSKNLNKRKNNAPNGAASTLNKDESSSFELDGILKITKRRYVRGVEINKNSMEVELKLNGSSVERAIKYLRSQLAAAIAPKEQEEEFDEV